MKKLFLLVILLILANCDIKPRTVQAAQSDESNESDNNKRVIATEGYCTLYAVRDNQRTIYWSVCTGGNDNSAVDAY